MTDFKIERLKFKPTLPNILQSLPSLKPKPYENKGALEQNIKDLFPKTQGLKALNFIHSEKQVNALSYQPQRLGVVFSGGQAPGGHNVISGLFDALKALNEQSTLIGFLNGPDGILSAKYVNITEQALTPFRNQGGFDLLGSGRTKIETQQQFEAAANTVQKLKIDGLVIIGGDDSNTNAAFLAEYFLAHNIDTKVVGVPKTIDGDLKNEEVEISFGFDTASKIYAHLIGNIQRDALSAKKYTHFIKLMGRTASHITLECALKTHANYALISEEIEAQHKNLSGIVKELADVICARAEQGKNYSIILVPEGLLEFCADCKQLIKDLSKLASVSENSLSPEEKLEKVSHSLQGPSKECFNSLPQETQKQLLLDRDPHGNINVSKIETEKLLIDMVTKELAKRKERGEYKGQFSPQSHFYGYEGRSADPSNFDANYCYALGMTAALIIHNKGTGYMASVKNLMKEAKDWTIAAIPFVSMLSFEERGGKKKAVIHKALVDLKGSAFKKFSQERSTWALDDNYCYPEPIQYFGPSAISDAITYTLALEAKSGNF